MFRTTRVSFCLCNGIPYNVLAFLGPEESLVRFICSNLVNITRVSYVLNSSYFVLVMTRPGAGISY